MKLAAIAVLAVVVGVSACSRSDPTITSKVKSELSDQHVPGNISVTTNEGVVTLAGSVPDIQVKARAEGIAKATTGVKYVVNELHTTMAGDAPVRNPPAAIPNLAPVPGGVPPQNAPPGGVNIPPNAD